MSDEERRSHIALSSRKGKKKARPPPPPEAFIKNDESKPEEDSLSDIGVLRSKMSSILNSANLRNDRIGIVEKNLYFIIDFYGRISWSDNRKLVNELPIEIKEILGETSLKVALKKFNYERFYYAMRRYLSEIKNVKQIEMFDKINDNLYGFIEKNPNIVDSYVLSFVDLGSTMDEELYHSIKKYIVNNKGIVSDVYESHNMKIFITEIKNIYLDKLITNIDSISLVEKKPEILLTGSTSFSLDFLETREVDVSDLEKLPNICIIDSGIYRNNNKIQGLIENTYDFFEDDYNPCKDNIPHGTCVAGLSIYGYNPSIVNTPSSKVIMLKNFDLDQGNVIEKVHPLIAIKKAINLFNESKIFNFSFSAKNMDIGSTKALDQILFENEIISTTSAGNVLKEQIKQRIKKGETYPQYLSNYPIYFPGYCRNIITVGACTNVATSFVPDNAPSPFTRYGNMNIIEKPDVTEIGGNLEINFSNNDVQLVSRGFGISTTSNDDDFIEQFGSSFSSPIVANFLSRLWAQLNFSNPALLYAILLSSCDQLTNNLGSVYDKKLQGYGKPNLEKALYSNKYEVCYLLEGEFSSRHHMHLDEYEFYFPPKANRLEITLVCHKSETLYETENRDYVELLIEERPGPGDPYTYINTIMGNKKCYHTYKGYRDIKKGSKGEWIVQISPNFHTRDLYYLKMRYGCVIKVINTRRHEDIRKIINDNWLDRKLEEQRQKGEPLTEEVNPLIPVRLTNSV